MRSPGWTRWRNCIWTTTCWRRCLRTCSPGLTALAALDLDENVLTALPADVFAGLTALTALGLDDNLLETLPAGVFAGLVALTALDLDDNALRRLDIGGAGRPCRADRTRRFPATGCQRSPRGCWPGRRRCGCWTCRATGWW